MAASGSSVTTATTRSRGRPRGDDLAAGVRDLGNSGTTASVRRTIPASVGGVEFRGLAFVVAGGRGPCPAGIDRASRVIDHPPGDPEPGRRPVPTAPE